MRRPLTALGSGRRSPGRSQAVQARDTRSHGTGHSHHTLQHTHTHTPVIIYSLTVSVQSDLHSYSQMNSSGVCSAIMPTWETQFKHVTNGNNSAFICRDYFKESCTHAFNLRHLNASHQTPSQCSNITLLSVFAHAR